METQIIKYDITDAAIAEMKTRYMGLVITDLEDKEEFDAVHSARMVVKGKRVEVDKRRKELKADALAWGKKVQDEANRIFALIEPIETHLKKEENKVEEEQKRKEDARKAAIKDRIAGFCTLYSSLEGKGSVDELKAVIIGLECVKIEPDEFFEFTTEATETRQAIIERAKQDIETRERLDREEAEQKKEAERLAIERKKQEEITAKQKAEQDKIDAANRKITEEKAELEKAKKADQERKDREAFERKAKIQAEADAKERAEAEKREIIEAEKAAEAENKRQEALRPDKEKLVDLAKFLETIGFPKVETFEAKTVLQRIFKKIDDIVIALFNAAEKL